MKTEVNEAHSSTQTNGIPLRQESNLLFQGQNLAKKGLGLILGAISIFIAMTLIPLTLFINISTDALRNILQNNLIHYQALLCSIACITASISVTCGIFSAVLFAKSKKQLHDVGGLILSILAFVVCSVALSLIVLGYFN